MAEAKEQHLAKESKIDTLLKAVGLDNLAAAADIEEQAVRHKLARSGLLPAQSSDVGDRSLTIADNITYVQRPSPWPWLLGVLLALAGLAVGWLVASNRLTTAEPPRSTSTGGAIPVQSEPLQLRVRWWVGEDGRLRYEVGEDASGG